MDPVDFSPQLANVTDIEHSDAATAKGTGAKQVAPTTTMIASERLFMPSFPSAPAGNAVAPRRSACRKTERTAFVMSDLAFAEHLFASASRRFRSAETTQLSPVKLTSEFAAETKKTNA